MNWKHGRRFVNAENYRAPTYDLTPSGMSRGLGDSLIDVAVGAAVGYGIASLVDSFSSGTTDYGSSSDWSGGGGDSGGGGASGDW